nr:hypothetical protein [Amycolatopsis dendrobii]
MPQLAIDALDLLSDAEYAVVKIDVAPPEADCLTAAQPVEREQYEDRIERIGAGGIEET